jgi:HEAT repeat protein
MLAIPHVVKRAYHHLILSPRAVSAVERGLRHGDDAVRAHCCKLLDRLADEGSYDPLIEMLQDTSPAARAEALHALACDRCKAGVPTPDRESVLPLAIELLLTDEDKYVRAMAAEVVGKWAVVDEPAAAALTKAHERDAEPSVRKKAGWYAPGGSIYRKRVGDRSLRRAGRAKSPQGSTMR